MNPQVVEILKTLRSIQLNWIAEEIEQSILLGKTVEKTYREPGYAKQRRGLYTEAFTGKEEMQVTLRIIRSYFIELHDNWNSAVAAGIESIGTGKIRGRSPDVEKRLERITISDPNPNVQFELFSAEAVSHIDKLRGFIGEAEKEEGNSQS